ncbi:MAG: 7-cyano-7-deazaguanine synthase, partial [bacterium]
DCRPDFFREYQGVIKKGTKSGNIRVKTPLINMTKAEIIKLALKLKAPLELTWSCYEGGKRPCGKCDSCKLRAKGFAELET